VAVLLMRDVFLAEAVRTVPDEVVPRETRPLPEK
jgi:hypothetical protein